MCRLEEELDKDAVCHQFCSTCTANAVPRKLWMGLETSTSDGKLFKLKYADDLVQLAKEETVLQGMIDKLIEIGSCYGMEMNVEKTKVVRISRQPSPVTIMIDQQEEDSFYQQIGLKFEEGTNKMLHLEHGFVWC